MSPLGPRIGKIQMKTPDRIFRQQVTHRVVDLHPQNSQIRKAYPESLTASFPNSPKQTLDTEKIPVREFQLQPQPEIFPDLNRDRLQWVGRSGRSHAETSGLKMLGGNSSIDSSRLLVPAAGDDRRNSENLASRSKRSGTLPSKKGVMLAFVFDRGKRPMTRTDQRVVWQRKQLLRVIPKSFLVIVRGASH